MIPATAGRWPARGRGLDTSASQQRGQIVHAEQGRVGSLRQPPLVEPDDPLQQVRVLPFHLFRELFPQLDHFIGAELLERTSNEFGEAW